MVIKFIKCPIGLGYSYRKGGTAASLPDKICKELIAGGFAEDITPKPKPKAKPKDTQVKKAKVKTTQVTK